MKHIRVRVDPGICGFACHVEAIRQDKHHARVEIIGSDCGMINKMAEYINEITLNDIFMPHTLNPVFKAAERAGCHLTCPVPAALLKAAEVALELALPRDACIRFEPQNTKDAA